MFETTRTLWLFEGRVWTGPGRSFWCQKLSNVSEPTENDRRYVFGQCHRISVTEIAVPDWVGELFDEIRPNRVEDELVILDELTRLGIIRAPRTVIDPIMKM